MSSSNLIVFYFVFSKRQTQPNSFIMKKDRIKTIMTPYKIKTIEKLLEEEKIKSQLKKEEIQKLIKDCKTNEKQTKWFDISSNNYYKPKVIYYCSDEEIEELLTEVKKRMFDIKERYLYFYAQLLMYIAFSYQFKENIDKEFKDFFSNNIYLLSVDDALTQNPKNSYSSYLFSLLNSKVDFFKNNEKDEVNNTAICGKYFSTLLKLSCKSDTESDILPFIEKLLTKNNPKEQREKLLRDTKDQLIRYCIIRNKCNSHFLKIPEGMLTCSLDLSKLPNDIIGNKDEITYLNFIGKVYDIKNLSILTIISFKDILKMAFSSPKDKIALTYISIFQNIKLKNCIFIYNDAHTKKEKISQYFKSENDYQVIDISEIGFEYLIGKKNMYRSTIEKEYYCIKKNKEFKLTNLIPNWYFIDIESTPYELFKIFSIKLNSKKDCILSIEFNFEDETSCDLSTLIKNEEKIIDINLNGTERINLLKLKNCIKYFINSNLKNILEEDNYTLPPKGETFKKELRRIIQTFYWNGLLSQEINADDILRDFREKKISLLSDEEMKEKNKGNDVKQLIISALNSGSSLPSFIDNITINEADMLTILQTSLSLTDNYQKLAQEVISIYYNSKDKENKKNRGVITFLYNLIKSQKNKYLR